MTRFWVQFEKDKQRDSEWFQSFVINRGCGVTGYDKDDAIKIVHETFFKDEPMPPIKRIIENIDISTLDEGHVIPNMGNILIRGVCFSGDSR